MHGLLGTDCTQASLCGCTRPESVTRFVLHVAAFVMHCQLLVKQCDVVQPVQLLRRQGAHRWMACLAQIARRHHCVHALHPKA